MYMAFCPFSHSPSVFSSPSCLISYFMPYQELLTHFSGLKTRVSPLYSPYLPLASCQFYFFPFCLFVPRTYIIQDLSFLKTFPAQHSSIPPLLISVHLSSLLLCLMFCFFIHLLFSIRSYIPSPEINRLEGEFESIRKSVCQSWILVFIFMSNVAGP